MNESANVKTQTVTATDVGILIVRLGLGVMIFAHGAQKLLGWFGGPGPEGFIGFVGSLGIPAFLGWLAIIAEFFGGLGLIFGVLARLSALGVTIVMLVALFTVHLPHGFFIDWGYQQEGHGYELQILAIAMGLMVMLAGPGRLSILPDFEGRLLKRN